MIAGMTRMNALRAPIGGEMHLHMLLSLEEADVKPDGMMIVQSTSRKIRRQVTARLARALGRSVYEIDLAKLTVDHAGELVDVLEPLVAGAAMRGAMLFLDQADALFGSRHGDVAKIMRSLSGEGVFVVAGTEQYARTDRYWAEHLVGVLHE
jgi:hypothetical protein